MKPELEKLFTFLKKINDLDREFREELEELIANKSISRKRHKKRYTFSNIGTPAIAAGFLEKGFATIYRKDGDTLTVSGFWKGPHPLIPENFFTGDSCGEKIVLHAGSTYLCISKAVTENLLNKFPAAEDYVRRVQERLLREHREEKMLLSKLDAKEKFAHLKRTRPDVFAHATLKEIASYLGIRIRQLYNIRKAYGRS